MHTRHSFGQEQNIHPREKYVTVITNIWVGLIGISDIRVIGNNVRAEIIGKKWRKYSIYVFGDTTQISHVVDLYLI